MIVVNRVQHPCNSNFVLTLVHNDFTFQARH